jgi:hypothetical protein
MVVFPCVTRARARNGDRRPIASPLRRIGGNSENRRGMGGDEAGKRGAGTATWRRVRAAVSGESPGRTDEHRMLFLLPSLRAISGDSSGESQACARIVVRNEGKSLICARASRYVVTTACDESPRSARRRAISFRSSPVRPAPSKARASRATR